MHTLSITEARKRLFELRGRVVNDRESVIITHNNRITSSALILFGRL